MHLKNDIVPYRKKYCLLADEISTHEYASIFSELKRYNEKNKIEIFDLNISRKVTYFIDKYKAKIPKKKCNLRKCLGLCN